MLSLWLRASVAFSAQPVLASTARTSVSASTAGDYPAEKRWDFKFGINECNNRVDHDDHSKLAPYIFFYNSSESQLHELSKLGTLSFHFGGKRSTADLLNHGILQLLQSADLWFIDTSTQVASGEQHIQNSAGDDQAAAGKRAPNNEPTQNKATETVDAVQHATTQIISCLDSVATKVITVVSVGGDASFQDLMNRMLPAFDVVDPVQPEHHLLKRVRFTVFPVAPFDNDLAAASGLGKPHKGSLSTHKWMPLKLYVGTIMMETKEARHDIWRVNIVASEFEMLVETTSDKKTTYKSKIVSTDKKLKKVTRFEPFNEHPTASVDDCRDNLPGKLGKLNQVTIVMSNYLSMGLQAAITWSAVSNHKGKFFDFANSVIGMKSKQNPENTPNINAVISKICTDEELLIDTKTKDNPCPKTWRSGRIPLSFLASNIPSVHGASPWNFAANNNGRQRAFPNMLRHTRFFGVSPIPLTGKQYTNKNVFEDTNENVFEATCPFQSKCSFYTRMMETMRASQVLGDGKLETMFYTSTGDLHADYLIGKQGMSKEQAISPQLLASATGYEMTFEPPDHQSVKHEMAKDTLFNKWKARAQGRPFGLSYRESKPRFYLQIDANLIGIRDPHKLRIGRWHTITILIGAARYRFVSTWTNTAGHAANSPFRVDEDEYTRQLHTQLLKEQFPSKDLVCPALPRSYHPNHER